MTEFVVVLWLAGSLAFALWLRRRDRFQRQYAAFLAMSKEMSDFADALRGMARVASQFDEAAESLRWTVNGRRNRYLLTPMLSPKPGPLKITGP